MKLGIGVFTSDITRESTSQINVPRETAREGWELSAAVKILFRMHAPYVECLCSRLSSTSDPIFLLIHTLEDSR